MQQRLASVTLPLLAATFAACGDKKPAEPQVRSDILFERVAGNPSSETEAINSILKGGAARRGVYWVINTSSRQGFLVMYGTDSRRIMPGEPGTTAAQNTDTVVSPPNDGKVLIVPVPDAYALLGDKAIRARDSKDIEDFMRSKLPVTPADVANPSSPIITIQVRSADPHTLSTDFSLLELNRLHLVRLPVPTDQASHEAACYGRITQDPVIRSFNCLGVGKDALETSKPGFQESLTSIREQHRICAKLLCEIKPMKISANPPIDLFAFLERQLALYAFLSDNVKAVSFNEQKPVPRAPA